MHRGVEFQVMPAEGPPQSSAALYGLAKRIRASSNFLFAWQFFRLHGLDPKSSRTALRVLEAVVAIESCHEFLRSSFDAMYGEPFAVEPLHEHCSLDEADGDFEEILARAAGDRLGAYSRTLRPSTAAEREKIAGIFGLAGRYRAFQLKPGTVPGCQICAAHNNHVFSTWFYGVAWDWTFVVIWPEECLAWVGCLTDTD